MPLFSHRIALALAAALAAGGCSGPDRHRDGGGDFPDAAPDAAPDGPVLPAGLNILPADPTLTSADGAQPTQAFTLAFVDDHGTRTTLVADRWYLSADTLGAVDNGGLFTANGVTGGQVTLFATARDPGGRMLNAQTTVTIDATRRLLGPGVTDDDVTRVDTAPRTDDASRRIDVVYPLEGALMPANVAPPDVQWDVGEQGDVLRVRLSRPGVSIAAYVRNTGAGFGNHWAVDPAAWRALAEAPSRDPVELDVDRWDSAANQTLPGAPLHFGIAAGGAWGNVYYWGIDTNSRMYRIAVESGVRSEVLPAHTGCVGCHDLSRDGRYLVAQFERDDTRVIDLTADLTVDPPPTRFPPDRPYNAASFSPDASRMVVNYLTNVDATTAVDSLGLVDATTGALSTTSGLPTSGASSPSWSPDGTQLLYVQGGSDFLYRTDPTQLILAPANADGTFGAGVVLHRGVDLFSAREGGSVDARPTWGPDGQFIAFAHGTTPFSTPKDGLELRSALYILPRAGGAPVRLSRGMARGQDDAYWPTFSPFITHEPGGGRRYWLSFYSHQDYGNEFAGTRGAHHRQLWVMALDPDAPAGTDPSFAPFWLPGQARDAENMAARWAPAACRPTGEGCTVSSQCCSGSCRQDPSQPDRFTCQPPPPEECRRMGQTCGGSGDCCAGLVCNVNVCDVAPPG